MHPAFITALAFLSLAIAIPANREPMDERAVYEILAELEVRGEDIGSLLKRVDPDVFRDKIPDCSDDPSYIIPKKTGYSVDQGVKLPKSGKDDACTRGHNSDHCWTEYYFVESAIEFSSWQDSGSAIDCATTSTCNSDIARQDQTCTAHMNSKANGVDWQIVEFKLEKAIPNFSPKVSLGASVKYQHTDVSADTTQICTTTSSNSRCTWDDQDCHQVWFADRTKRIWGHVSRVCVGRTDSAVQQQTENKNGRWVRGQAEFSIALPVNTIVGCNAKCGDLSYNEPTPNEGLGRVPFDISFE